MKLSTIFFIASMSCLVVMLVSSNGAFWFFLGLLLLWRSDFHQISEQILEIKELLRK